jgi:hypothetical protein
LAHQKRATLPGEVEQSFARSRLGHGLVIRAADSANNSGVAKVILR